MQRFRALCRRYAGWIVITLALLLCQHWWIARNRPERLLELPAGYDFVRLHDGVLLLRKQDASAMEKDLKYMRRPGSNKLVPVMTFSRHSPPDPNASKVFALPVTGGPLRPVSPDDPDASPDDAVFTTGADTYRVEYRKTTPGLVGIPPRYGRSFGYPKAGTIGSTKPSPSPPKPNKPKPPFHTVTFREEADSVSATLRCVSSSGYITTVTGETLTCPMGYISTRLMPGHEVPPPYFQSKIAFAGNAIYWIKHFPDEWTYRVSSNGQTVGKGSYKYHTSVMSMPVHGGTAQELLNNVPSDTQLTAAENSVFCWVNKGSEGVWLRVRPDGTSQQVLTNASQDEMPVEVGNHLYWRRSHNPTTEQLMQANGDGSGSRILYTASNNASIGMRVWRGQVYFRVVDALAVDQSGVVYRSTLYRVNPALPSGVERLCALPDNARPMLFDGDYVYCLTGEEKKGMMDTTRAKSSLELRSVLYRYRLPAH